MLEEYQVGPARHIHHEEQGTRTAGKAIRSLLITELPDEIDVMNCDAIAAGLLAAVSAPGLVIADMTGTAYCDSAGMRMLLAVHDHARASRSVLRVAVKPDSSVTRMMSLLGMDRVLSCYASVEGALLADGAPTAAGRVRRVRMPELCRIPLARRSS